MAKVIRNFKMDFSDVAAGGGSKSFSIEGDPGAIFSLEIKNEDGYYYNFTTRSFAAAEKRLKQQAIHANGTYKGNVLFPSVSDQDQYDIYLFANSHYDTIHDKYKGVRFLVENRNSPSSVYRVSCSNSIWNRTWFLKTLERNYSTGAWETIANDGRNNNDGFDVISPIDRWTPALAHTVGRNWNHKFNVYGMHEEDIQYLKSISSESERANFIDSVIDEVVNLEGYQPRPGYDTSNV